MHTEPTLSYTDIDSPEYAQARELRYDSLYADWDLPWELIEDTDGRVYRHLVALEGERVVGYGRLHLEDGESKIYQLCVARDRRGCGIAKALVRELMSLAAAEGRTEICLDAREHVVGFYEALGFECEGEPFLSGRTGTPHRFMRRRLP